MQTVSWQPHPEFRYHRKVDFVYILPAMKDSQIRDALKSDLLARYSQDPDTVIIDELGLRHGASRIDVVVVNGNLHGFELKSDRDTLKRLPRQTGIYNSILDFVT